VDGRARRRSPHGSPGFWRRPKTTTSAVPSNSGKSSPNREVQGASLWATRRRWRQGTSTASRVDTPLPPAACCLQCSPLDKMNAELEAMSVRTVNALVARGLDSATSHELVRRGYTLASLRQLSADQLKTLGLDQSQVAALSTPARPPIPEATLTSVLFRSRWTCCVCRDSTRGIIIHHIMEWSQCRSHEEDNLVALCLLHHDEAHTKRELTLSLSAERIRQLRAEWYSLVDSQRSKEAANLAQIYSSDHRLHAIHRGAQKLNSEEVMIFGNDGYSDSRTKECVKLVRQGLAAFGLPEVAFALSEDEGTWVLIVRTEEEGLMSALVWDSFMRARRLKY